jgi:enoyl-CoA hydratase/carnithine racemase
LARLLVGKKVMIETSFQANGEIALLILSKPPSNAFTLDGLVELRHRLQEINEDHRVRAVVITGDGPKFFSAGADLNMFAEGDKAVARLVAQRFGDAFEVLQNARPVVIAAINGYAMGGGLECALACDIRIAEAHAQLALPEATVGLLPCGCGTQTLPWLVGEGWAKKMILTGERVDAQTALRIGLVEDLVDTGKAREAALAMAKRVTTLSPQGVEFSKKLIHQARKGVPRAAGLAVERERFVDLFDHPDQREGVTAFLQKRPARWRVVF